MKAGLLGAVLGVIIGLAISSLTICRGAYAKCENEAIKPIIIWVEHKEPQVEVINLNISDNSLEYLARCVEAEAGNQGIIGKRLVCDVILNRVDHKNFPDTIEGVINQKNQFSVVSNGSIDKVKVSEETLEACIMELDKRIDSEILYFTAGNYGKYGTPAYNHKEHYFSK